MDEREIEEDTRAIVEESLERGDGVAVSQYTHAKILAVQNDSVRLSGPRWTPYISPSSRVYKQMRFSDFSHR